MQTIKNHLNPFCSRIVCVLFVILGYAGAVVYRFRSAVNLRAWTKAVLRRQQPIPVGLTTKLTGRICGRRGQTIRRAEHYRHVFGIGKRSDVQRGKRTGGPDKKRLSAGQATFLVRERSSNKQFQKPTADVAIANATATIAITIAADQ